MMSDRFENEKYVNWLKVSLALIYAKEGLERFTDTEVQNFHRHVSTLVPTAVSPLTSVQTCCVCLKKDIKKQWHRNAFKCTANICDRWIRTILSYHMSPRPLVEWDNADISQLPKSAWECAKLFMSFGCQNSFSVEEFDFASLLTLYIKCRHFHGFIQHLFLCEQVREIRNKTMHSGQMEIETSQMQMDVPTILRLLQDPKHFNADSHCQDAVRKIQELMDGTLELSLNEELELRIINNTIQDINNKVSNLRHQHETMSNEILTLTADVGVVKAEQTDNLKMKSEMEKVKQDIEKVKHTAHTFSAFLQAAKIPNVDVARLTKIECSLNDLSQCVDQCQQTLTKHEECLQKHESELSKQKAELSEQKAQLSKQKAELGEHKVELSGNKAKLSEHEAKLSKHKGELSEQKAELGEHKAELSEHKVELSEHEAELSEHKAELSEQKAELSEQKAELSEQKSELSEHKAELNEHEAELSEHKIELSEHKVELSEHKAELCEQKRSIENLRRQQECHATDQKKTQSSTSGVALTEEELLNLQTLLKKHYRNTCLVVQDPAEDSDIELKYLYAEPAVRVLRQSKGRDGLTNVKEEAASMSCRQIFYTDDYRARQIYITGDAGLGKSMLCKHLVELWCEAHGDRSSVVSDDNYSDSDGSDDNDSDSDEEGLWSQRHAEQKARREENRQILSRFKFLFYITLRDSLSEYTITEMIQSQILQYYENKHVKVSDVLKNECCLVIIDGLDEWVCPEGRKVPHFVNPGIPGRDISDEHTVFLTTTRPWKFDVLRLTNVDKHAELCGIDKLSASQLCSKVIKLLNKSETERKRKREFYRALKQKGLDHFKTIPVILIQLICLWFDDQELCKSQVQLYCSMLNMLLKKALDKLTGQTTHTPSSVQSETLLHKCFMNHPHCQNHQQLIICLSKVAFEALVDKTKENQLVFESSIMRIYGVDEDSINLCLKSGILSQNKMLVKRSVSEKKFSFLHKKFQEFLASVFIANSEDVQNVSKRLTEFCSTVKGCLEMSQVWLFVSGMRPDIARQLLDHFTNVITADTDKLIHNYRQTLLGEGLILDIQTCVTNCISEGESNGHKYEKIRLNDVYIDQDTLRHVERMLLGNVWKPIKSVYINTSDMTGDQLALITGQLGQTKSLEKLHLVDWRSRIPSETLETVIDNICTDSLTCLDLEGNIGLEVGNRIELEHGSVSAICRSISKRLMSLGLLMVKLTHVDKVELLHKLSQSSSIRELVLELYCTDHDYPQCRPRIDVSTMTQLQTLRLSFMCVDNLPTVTQCMERVVLGFVTLSMTTLREFVRNISQTKRHVKVTLHAVTVREESEDRVDLKTFLRERPGLTVTYCEYRDSDKRWTINFHTDSKT